MRSLRAKEWLTELGVDEWLGIVHCALHELGEALVKVILVKWTDDVLRIIIWPSRNQIIQLSV
jgi:hypothetical protein